MELFTLPGLYGIFSFTAAVISVVIAIYLVPHWQYQPARALTLLMAGVAIWSGTYGMEFISTDITQKLLWVKMEYLGAVWISPLVFWFISSMINQKFSGGSPVFMSFILICLIFLGLALTNSHHHLMWQKAWLDTSGNIPAMRFVRGVGFWLFLCFSYGLIMLAVIRLFRALSRASGIYKKQLAVVLVGIFIPWLANIIYLFGFDMLQPLDLTPVAFMISGMIFLWGLVRYQRLSLIPLAREAVLDSMTDRIISLDLNDRVLGLNRPARSMFNMDTFAPAQRHLLDLDPRLHDFVVRNRKNDQVEVETSFSTGDQVTHWHIRISPLLSRKEKRIGWLLILQDITDRKNMENAFKESEQLQRTILESSPDPIVLYNDKGEVTYLNPSFTRVFGWTLAELSGKQIDFVPEENKAETWEAIQKTYEKPDTHFNFITRRYTKSGDILDVSINSTICRTREDSDVNMVVNFTDITRLKKTERELIRARNYIRSIINSMPSIIIGLDPDGIILQWNARAEEVTGLPSGTVEGQLIKAVLPSFSNLFPLVATAMEKQAVQNKSRQNLNIAGSTFLADITIYPNLSDNIPGAVIRVDDISERVMIEEMMVQSEKMLSVGGLAAGMAHEINNPLAGILQNIQVMRNRLSRDLPANIKAADECRVGLEVIKSYMEKRDIFMLMDRVEKSGRRAAHIVENMLTFSRKSDQKKANRHLYELMDAALELVKSDYNIKKRYDFRSIEITRDYQDNVPLVLCDENQIQQVFLNILKNGAEAMTDAGVTDPEFHIRYFFQEGRVVCEIGDNGPGMAEEVKKRIFEPFFTTKAVGEGTGLGLSVSYFIITKNHSGTLAVETRPGEGSLFIITLPASKGG